MARPGKVFILLAGSATALVAALWRFTTSDDAYITYRYARNIARGLGPVYNAGERVEGCTAFFHMIFLAPFMYAQANPRIISALVSILGIAMIGALGAAWIARQRRERPGAWPWFYPAVIGTSPALVYWAAAGLETVWFTAAVFAAVMAAEREAECKAWPIGSALLVLLASLIRPDGLVLAGTIGLFWLLVQKERPVAKAAVFGTIFGTLFGAYFFWRFSYYGYLLPNTYYAKVGRHDAMMTLRGILYVANASIAGVFPAAALWLLHRARRARMPLTRFEKLALVVLGGQVFQSAWAGGDFMPFFRFMLPVWPLSVLLVFSLATRLPDARRRDGRGSAGFWRLAGKRSRAVKILLAVHLAFLFWNSSGIKALMSGALSQTWKREAKALAPLVPEDATVAAMAIGLYGYLVDRPLIDMMGVTDAAIAHTTIATGRSFPGHEKTQQRVRALAPARFHFELREPDDRTAARLLPAHRRLRHHARQHRDEQKRSISTGLRVRQSSHRRPLYRRACAPREYRPSGL
ncbi:MAG: hypothetical protein M5R36_16730 [Deltaproteobacteria bacterium]|nr:hypothetical protein [Deltaproteobacteria bacterium]